MAADGTASAGLQMRLELRQEFPPEMRQPGQSCYGE
jgi:hypothetical protein